MTEKEAAALIAWHNREMNRMNDEIRRLQEENERLNEYVKDLKEDAEFEQNITEQAIKSMERDVSDLAHGTYELKQEITDLIEVLQWIVDAGTDYQSINKAREVLQKYGLEGKEDE